LISFAIQSRYDFKSIFDSVYLPYYVTFGHASSHRCRLGSLAGHAGMTKCLYTSFCGHASMTVARRTKRLVMPA
jgi:hypothetical protein